MTRARHAVCAALVLVGAACTSSDGAAPKPRPEPSTPTTELDTSGISLAGVSGQTTTTIVERGTASITGTVTSPDGLLVGATIRIERLVGGREIRTDLVTGPDGRFLLENIPGGRYRVRAFLAPSLAQVVPDVRFLPDDKAHTFDLEVERLSGVTVRADVAPEPPLLRRPVNLVATVANRTVDANGIVRSTPVVGLTVELVGLGRWVLRDDASEAPDDDTNNEPSSPFEPTTTTTQGAPPSPFATTGAGGQVRYELRCEASGAPGLALRVPVTRRSGSGETATTQTTTETIKLDLPACVDPSTLTTTSTSTTVARSSTTNP